MGVRILAKADVEDLLDLPGAMRCIEEVFKDQADGGVAAWPPSLMRSDGALFIMRSGGIAAQHRMGVRVTTGPYTPSYALVYDTPSGHLLSFMVYPFSDLRLDATVALATDHLAPPTVQRMALIGTGRLALGLLQAIARVRPFKQLAAYSRRPEPREAFAAKAQAALGVPVTAVDDPEEAVADADVVLTITSSRTPALRGAWLRPSTFVIAAGDRGETDEEVFMRASQIVTTSKVQELNIHEYTEDWPLVRATKSGRVSWDGVLELGQIVAGRVPRADGIVVFREAQGGFGDIALAGLAYRRALELGRGQEIELS